MPEVLGPSVVTFARPELSVRMLPPLLRGDEVWCPGSPSRARAATWRRSPVAPCE
jgi:hypothetical protein